MQPQDMMLEASPAAVPGASARLVLGKFRACMVLVVVLLFTTRIFLMVTAPLADKTEARYGEIARQTVSNGFWLMPHVDARTPFFAKPPLSTWASAVSMKVLGINEFSARLPSLLLSLPVIWMTAAFAGRAGVRARWLVIPILASCPVFFVSAGAVMTDMLQLAVVWGAHWCAWNTLVPGGAALARRWRLAFWALVGLGALTKGLATWVLIGLPLIAFAIVQGQQAAMLRRLFALEGIALALAIFLPWYVAAEYFYPGFVNYFIVGEHFSRFFQAGWTGDRYGYVHSAPWGAVWVFWCIGIAPWLYVFGSGIGRLARRRTVPLPSPEKFLWCAILAPLLFFTFSRNLIWTYALTAVPPFAVLAVRWLEDSSAQARGRMTLVLVVYAGAVLLSVPSVQGYLENHSERSLVRAFEQKAPAGAHLKYAVRPTYSSAFYTQGTRSIEKEAPPAGGARHMFVVMENDDVRRQAIPPARILFTNDRRSIVEMK